MNLGGSSKQPQVKAVILGSTEVGKSSLCRRFELKEFDEYTKVTISAVSHQINMKVLDQDITLCIWDTAGQEKFRSIAPIYYRGAHVAVIVFDLTSPSSLNCAKEWVDEFRAQGPPGAPIVFLANKSDLEQYIQVDKSLYSQMASDLDSRVFEVSARSGQNVDEAFSCVAEQGLTFYRGVNPFVPIQEEPQPKNQGEKKCC